MSEPSKEPEVILKGVAREIIESDEFKESLRTLGPEKMRANITNGLAKLEACRKARAATDLLRGDLSDKL